MKKLVINLHPEKKQEDPEIIKIASRYIPFLFLGLIAMAAINIFLFALTNIFQISHRTLNKDWERLSPQINEIKTLREELTASKAEKKEYEIMVNHKTSFSQTMSSLFGALPKNIWLRSISLGERRIDLDGYVVTWKEDPLASLDKFIKQLSLKGKYFAQQFNNISLKSYRKAVVFNTEVISFKVEGRK